jgi:hypothetical protein
LVPVYVRGDGNRVFRAIGATLNDGKEITDRNHPYYHINLRSACVRYIRANFDVFAVNIESAADREAFEAYCTAMSREEEYASIREILGLACQNHENADRSLK